MTADDYFAIQNLINQYFDLVDAGRFDDCGALFHDAEMVYVPSGEIISKDPASIAAKMHSFVHLYGKAQTPMTFHQSSNIQIKTSGANHATSSCRAVIYQSTQDLPFQAIGAAHYKDEFEKRGSEWIFTRREMGLNFIGNINHHLKKEISP